MKFEISTNDKGYFPSTLLPISSERVLTWSFSSSLDSGLFCLAFLWFWRKSEKSRLSKVNAMPSFDVNAKWLLQSFPSKDLNRRLSVDLLSSPDSKGGKAESRPSKVGLNTKKAPYHLQIAHLLFGFHPHHLHLSLLRLFYPQNQSRVARQGKYCKIHWSVCL